jgi:hypothetical protein
MKDDASITMALAIVFLLGLLWAGWMNGIKSWIHSKVNES